MTKSNNLLADYAAKKQDICIKNDTISDSLFREYGVNRGLRDVNGKGVLTGLTNISEIVSFKTGEDGSSVPCDGQLWYRGYNVKTLTNNLRPGEFGFEKIAYLLLFGQLPSESEYQLYEGCHHEGSVKGYHEFHDEKYTDTGFI